MRKKQLSIDDIKGILDAEGLVVSTTTIHNICLDHGFTHKLPRRSKKDLVSIAKSNDVFEKLEAPRSKMITFSDNEEFMAPSAGVMLFLPLIQKYGLDKAIVESSYPETKTISKLSMILAHVALKLIGTEIYHHDDSWCFDRSLGAFASLNVLPKGTCMREYSSSITREQNIEFLMTLNKIFAKHGLFSDTQNLDYSTIQFYGDDLGMEERSSIRREAVTSFQAVVAQDNDSGIITYSNATIMHANQNDVILEFLETYYKSTGQTIKYVVFDSKFTTLKNLAKLNSEGVKFITIQRRCKNLVKKADQLMKNEPKSVMIKKANKHSRIVKYSEDKTINPAYGDCELRQIFIETRGTNPAIIITNDFDLKASAIIKKYSELWLIETTISEQIHFFNINKNKSAASLNIDFDLTMSVFAFNLYRLLARELPRYEHCIPKTLNNIFIKTNGTIEITDDFINVKLVEKRHKELILSMINRCYPNGCSIHN
ncbi:MAG: transposase [Christensenellaceae bacterium]|nr:transposase [Christensenellaceae bacterium]